MVILVINNKQFFPLLSSWYLCMSNGNPNGTMGPKEAPTLPEKEYYKSLEKSSFDSIYSVNANRNGLLHKNSEINGWPSHIQYGLAGHSGDKHSLLQLVDQLRPR